MEIIPAIDIIDGKCVRLTQGDYSQKKQYHTDPLEVAKKIENAGIRRLHLVDLDGAKQKKIVNRKILETIAKNTALIIDFGGGVQSDEDIKMAFELGANQVTGGSVAIKKPELFDQWLSRYGNEKIILGADVKGEQIAISGWEEKTDVQIEDFLQKYIERSIQYVICTDVSKDGLLQGPSFGLYKKILKLFPNLKLIASGGVANIDDVVRLSEMGVYGVIIGKAIYEGNIELNDLANFIG